MRIATRESQLALWQAEFVAAELRRAYPEVQVELVPMTTRGDQWLSAPLSQVGGKGLFIKELEVAMQDGRADLAVHSMKDVPAVMPDGFVLAAIGHRADPRDALVGPGIDSLESVAQGARIGSSSLRRQAQLKRLRPDLDLQPVRGNVNTRLAKLDSGEFDALVLAVAGLERLGFGDRIAATLPVTDSLPAAGQGALGIECLSTDARVLERVAVLNEGPVAECVIAERTVTEVLGASCSTPLGAFAERQADGALWLRARLADPSSDRLLVAEATGADPRTVGRSVADALIEQGARELLASFEAAIGAG